MHWSKNDTRQHRALIKAHGLRISPGDYEHDSLATLKGHRRKLEPRDPLIAFENPQNKSKCILLQSNLKFKEQP